jgi:hypothetical protein
LLKDPLELRNVYSDPAYAGTVTALKQELARLRREVDDRDEFANELPGDGVDGQTFTPAPSVR